MKIRVKIIGVLGVMILMANGILFLFMIISANEVRRLGNTMTYELGRSVEENARQELLDLAQNISNYVLALEAEIDRNMHNAANLLVEVDRLTGGNITLAELQRLNRLTGMSDLYLTDINGVFILTTEIEAVGISLFDIWDGYRMLVTGESDYLPSDLKMKVETGEIFKFTAIPRAAGRGVAQSALNAGAIEDYLQSFIDTSISIRSMYLFDYTMLTLTENRRQGTRPFFTRGAFVPAAGSPIAELFNNSSRIQLTMDREDAQIYYPVIDGGRVRYVLFIDLDTSSYFTMEHVIDATISELVQEISILNIISSLVVFVVLVVFTIIISILIHRLLKPLGFFNSLLTSFSNGDLTLKVPEEYIKRKDEMGDISQSFGNTVDSVKNLVLKIKNEADDLSSIGNDLANNMTKTAAAINQITANIQNIKDQVQSQSAGVSETHSTMEQFALHIQKLSDHIQSQSSNISQASSAIEQMVANTRTVTETLMKNATNVNALNEASSAGHAGLQEVASSIQEIARESEGLLEINSVMNNIASQTNLLSMNAAIEAAHAGESGKGFAVVADEIRKLAESAGKQSKTIGTVLKKIKESIDKITKDTGNVLNMFEAIDSRVKTVAEQEEHMRNAMEEQAAGNKQILEGVSNVNEITADVKLGSAEMLEGTKQVIHESEALEKITHEISVGMNEMATSAEQINSSADQVNDISVKNREGIAALLKEVSRFTVK